MKTLCHNCILPLDYPGITSNSQGICSFCQFQENKQYLGKDELQKQVDEILTNHKERKYDCIVGLSGGRDSTYLLWFVVTQLKLKPLAVFVDSGLIPEQTIQNIKTTVSILNVDLVIKNNKNLRRVFKHNLLAWSKKPVPPTLINFCVGCRYGTYRYVTEEAIRRKIPIIFRGGTPFEGRGYKKSIVRINPNNNSKLSFLVGYFFQILKNPFLISNPINLMTQIKEYYMLMYKNNRLLKKNNITLLKLFQNFYRWEESKIEETLRNELHWERHPELQTSYRGDCEIGLIRQYLYYKTLGYNDKDDHLSCLIRDKQITRDEALKRIVSERFIPENTLVQVFQKTGIDFHKFMKKINRSI